MSLSRNEVNKLNETEALADSYHVVLLVNTGCIKPSPSSIKKCEEEKKVIKKCTCEICGKVLNEARRFFCTCLC